MKVEFIESYSMAIPTKYQLESIALKITAKEFINADFDMLQHIICCNTGCCGGRIAIDRDVFEEIKSLLKRNSSIVIYNVRIPEDSINKFPVYRISGNITVFSNNKPIYTVYAD